MEVSTFQLGDLTLAEHLVNQAAEVLNSGGLVVFPTETVYGIAASVASEQGLSALRAFKERADNQPFTIHVPGIAELGRFVDFSGGGGNSLRRLIGKTLPGPVTLVVEMSDDEIAERVAAMCNSGPFGKDADQKLIRERIYHKNSVGLRCPEMAEARQFLACIDAPIVASSANRRGQAPPLDVDAAARAVGDAAGLLIDGGRCRFSKPSTIIRVPQASGKDDTQGDSAIQGRREGVYDERFIRKLLRFTVLMVCTGNTCRSPMAEGIARKLLAKTRGVAIDDLEEAGIQILSAGAFAMDGTPVSPEAIEVMGANGVDISHYRSTALTPQLVYQADVIYCMTRSHMDAVLGIVPAAADRVFLVDPDGDIPDPIGGPLEIYEDCRAAIERGLERQLKEHLS